jgi:hypothetical protein
MGKNILVIQLLFFHSSPVSVYGFTLNGFTVNGVNSGWNPDGDGVKAG